MNMLPLLPSPETFDECVICLEKLVPYYKIIKSTSSEKYKKEFNICSGHYLHKDCLEKYENSGDGKKCPQCRLPIIWEDENGYKYFTMSMSEVLKRVIQKKNSKSELEVCEAYLS